MLFQAGQEIHATSASDACNVSDVLSPMSQSNTALIDCMWAASLPRRTPGRTCLIKRVGG
ncbi:MAG: hypothetical protein GPOALKHO_001567 [Sodalis sp.]|nr:MAG: hypothetical protein GPOALKHO_001567 [Sodalis sp.]